jgi:hypothetical protein
MACLAGEHAETPQRNEAAFVEFHAFRLEPGALEFGVFGVPDGDLAAPRVLFADDSVPRKRLRTDSHRLSHDAVSGWDAGELGDFPVRRDTSSWNATDGRIDRAFTPNIRGALRRSLVKGSLPRRQHARSTLASTAGHIVRPP